MSGRAQPLQRLAMYIVSRKSNAVWECTADVQKHEVNLTGIAVRCKGCTCVDYQDCRRCCLSSYLHCGLAKTLHIILLDLYRIQTQNFGVVRYQIETPSPLDLQTNDPSIFHKSHRLLCPIPGGIRTQKHLIQCDDLQHRGARKICLLRWSYRRWW